MVAINFNTDNGAFEMIKKISLLLLLLFLLVNCSGIKMISGELNRNLYSEEFLAKIENIKKIYSRGGADRALQKLHRIKREEVSPIENSLRKNLIGVILFHKKDYEKAIYHFSSAINGPKTDPALNSQIYLNLASSYYKLGFFKKSLNFVSKSQVENLNKSDARKFHLLSYKLNQKFGNDIAATHSLIRYFLDYNTLEEMRQDRYFLILKGIFLKLEESTQDKILQTYYYDRSAIVGLLGYVLGEKTYYGGAKERGLEIINWIESGYESNHEIMLSIRKLKKRIQNISLLNIHSIGLVLPLTGSKGRFGKRAFYGIDYGLKKIKSGQVPFDLTVKDSKGSGIVGSVEIENLIEREKVSIIIGGLFPQEAKKEYLAAKKHGVFFISLSPIYLPREEKDHLLLEIPGSVESQVEQIFSQKMATFFGKRAAILYPKTARGRAYLDEFWRQASFHNVAVVGALGLDKNKTDYREPVSNLLGLKHKREREEEYKLLQEIYKLEKKGMIKRIQTLRPQVDFDWAFIPTFPKEALLLIPTFSYFDAFGLKVIGGPSWRSQLLAREKIKSTNIYFVGDDIESVDENILREFKDIYKKGPKIIELRSMDALLIAAALVANKKYSTREEFDFHIRRLPYLKGATGTWNLKDTVWIKDLATHKISYGKFKKIMN